MNGLGQFLFFAFGCLIGWALGQDGNWVPLVIWVVLSVSAWVFSCWRHPVRPCGLCNGSGRHRGLIFWYADRRCLRCHGNPRFLRLGSRIFGFSENSPAR